MSASTASRSLNKELLVELLLDARLGHVGRKVNLVGQGLDLDREALLHSGKDLVVFNFATRVHSLRNEANGHSPVSEASSTANPMHIRVGVHREVVIEDDVDPLDIEPTRTEIRRHQNTRLEFLELVVLCDTAIRQDEQSK